LRCLRDEAGFWSFQYKKSLKNNTLPAALFGAVFGPLFAVDLAGLSLAVRRGQSVFQVEFLVISIIFLLGFALNLAIQIPLIQLPVSALLKNAFLLFRGNLGCSLMAVAALIGYAALFVLLPATLSFLLIVSNLWLPMLTAAFLLYGCVERNFSIESRILQGNDPDPFL